MIKTNKPQIIYIAGYGRSGSTLLDILLGNHPYTIGTGELGNLFEAFNDNCSCCSCGKSYRECEVWSKVIGEAYPGVNAGLLSSHREIQQKVERWNSFPFLSKFIPSLSCYCKRYCFVMDSLFSAICKISGKNVIVDSSKSAYAYSWRAFALSRFCQYDVKLVHLVRDGRSVMLSKMKGNNKKMRKGLSAKEPFAAYRALAGWIVANFFSVITRFLLPKGSYCLIKYEDLVTRPREVLHSLDRFTQLDMGALKNKIKNNDTFSVGHLIAGNRITQKKQIRLSPFINNHCSLPKHLVFFYYFLGWPIILYIIFQNQGTCKPMKETHNTVRSERYIGFR